MRGKPVKRERRRVLSDTMDRLAGVIDREFDGVDADFVLVVEHRGLVGLMSSLEDEESIQALLAAGAETR